MSKLSETEFHTKILLEEKRGQIPSEARFELLLPESSAEHVDHSIQNFDNQFRSQIPETFRSGRSTNLPDMNKIYYEQNYNVERVFQEVRRHASQELEELKKAQNWRMGECSRQELQESQFTVTELTAQVQEDKVRSMSDSRGFQDFESVCSSRLSHVPSQPVIVSSPCGVPSRNHRQRLDARTFYLE